MDHPLFSLDGCVAVVTGAGRGMGLGVAETLARLGATVAVNDYYPERAAAAAEELTGKGLKAFAAPADVTDYQQVQQMVAAVRERAGTIDIYVSNAGVPTTGMGYARFLESTPADWESFVRLNMYGLMNGCHAVLPGMIEQGYGRIVAITSESWRAGVPMGIAAYAASKAGVVGFVRQLAAETGRKGVTVNALSLGTMNNWEGSEELACKIGFVPRAGSPADVGAGVAYLASREASWVTGQVYPLNGGSLTA
ncbi:SDR family NAD(P)-dependent oxidoreductase [Pseudomonas sp.]|uniref:SDR family NAD(P)-dependent oxidoreductase n=1 Tax=Pseudomonas sp. TaxID=306 RepID=UPI00262DFA98|nr:SDR family NAD(P)-dependent oxidoreductase [Pseudomonas sp.]